MIFTLLLLGIATTRVVATSGCEPRVVANCNEWLRGPRMAGLFLVCICIDVETGGKKQGTVEFLYTGASSTCIIMNYADPLRSS